MAIAIFPQKSNQKPTSQNVALDTYHPLSQGMVGCFLLNEGAGNAVQEYVTHSRVGTWNLSNMQWGHSISGYGPAFNGSDYAIFPKWPQIQAPLPMSMVACVRPTALGANRGITTNSNGLVYSGISMFAHPAGPIQINIGDGGGSTSGNRRSGFTTIGTVAVDQTTHLVGVIRDATDMDIYVNGVRDTLGYDGSGGAIAYGGDPVVGTWAPNASPWIGWIYHVYYYNRVITPSEALWLYEEQYCMLKPVKSRVFSIGSGSGGGVPATVQQPLIFVAG